MITILTAPSPLISYKINRKCRDFVRRYIKGKELVKYHGHPAVARSLIEGLTQCNEKFIFNPHKINSITDHVHVLGGLEALKYAIHLKKKGKINRLTAGPNIVISSADHQGIIASKEIDFYLVNSIWTKDAYLKDNPLLKNRIGVFPSGVDVDYWKVDKTKEETKRVLFYHKRPDPILYHQCKMTCADFGFEVEEIIYGKHNHDNLKEMLRGSDFVVYFVEQESQGLALIEIWASDTPTLVWNPGEWSYDGNLYPCSSAPFLTNQTGLFFKDHHAFEKLITNTKEKLNKQNFSPRNWVKNNLTDQLSATQFLNLIN